MSRLISDLVPELQDKFHKFAGLMAETGIPFILTSTYRSQLEQDLLWAKGRTEPGPKVTWVKVSRHTGRTAFDIAILMDGKPVWDTKVNVNNNEFEDYLEAGQIGESIGLKWGGRWKTRDLPHFELA